MVYGVGGAAALAKDEVFSDVPEFSGVLKPLPAAWLPAATVDEFGAAMREVRREADEAAREADARAGATPRR